MSENLLLTASQSSTVFPPGLSIYARRFHVPPSFTYSTSTSSKPSSSTTGSKSCSVFCSYSSLLDTLNFLSLLYSYAQETALLCPEFISHLIFSSATKKSELSFTLLPDSLCNYKNSNTFFQINQVLFRCFLRIYLVFVPIPSRFASFRRFRV